MNSIQVTHSVLKVLSARLFQLIQYHPLSLGTETAFDLKHISSRKET